MTDRRLHFLLASLLMALLCYFSSPLHHHHHPPFSKIKMEGNIFFSLLTHSHRQTHRFNLPKWFGKCPGYHEPWRKMMDQIETTTGFLSNRLVVSAQQSTRTFSFESRENKTGNNNWRPIGNGRSVVFLVYVAISMVIHAHTLVIPLCNFQNISPIARWEMNRYPTEVTVWLLHDSATRYLPVCISPPPKPARLYINKFKPYLNNKHINVDTPRVVVNKKN